MRINLKYIQSARVWAAIGVGSALARAGRRVRSAGWENAAAGGPAAPAAGYIRTLAVGDWFIGRSVVFTVAALLCGAAFGADTALTTGYLIPRAIGSIPEANQPAWITDLTIVDLDQDGLKDIVCCDARVNRIVWIRQISLGEFVEEPIGDLVSGPAHVEAVDFDADGDIDLLIAGMGVVPPNNERIGSVVVFENDGQQRFISRVILSGTYRVTDVRAGDLNGDGRLDLAVAQFGYYEGQIQWLENLGSWKFASHPLLDLSGAIHAPIVDTNNDGKLDIVGLVSQDWEEIWAFENRGGGGFSNRVLHGSTNRDYGSSGLCVADVDRDGLLDLVYTNGDGFDYATPGSRPWHGVQWLRNDGRGNFRFRRIGDFAGAYSPVVIDLDGDGDNDVIAVSAFNDWTKPDVAALVCFENDGQETFTRRVLAHTPSHMVVVKAADMNNDGTPELVTGCFAFYPPRDRAARVMIWERPKDNSSAVETK
jgi:hypothetical protein